MASIRLYESQVKYLRERGGCNTLYSAITRFRRGELVTEKRDFARKHEKLLPYSLHLPITEYTGSQVRAILFASMRNPVNHQHAIGQLDGEINAFLDSFANVAYFKKEQM